MLFDGGERGAQGAEAVRCECVNKSKAEEEDKQVSRGHRGGSTGRWAKFGWLGRNASGVTDRTNGTPTVSLRSTTATPTHNPHVLFSLLGSEVGLGRTVNDSV